MGDHIELVEYVPKELARKEINEETGRWIWDSYGDRIQVEFPNPATDFHWRLCSQGWVGYIPIDRDRGISIAPKVPISNVFRMLEYAYRLSSFEILDELYDSSSLQEFYDTLAGILAKRVLLRGRRGYYRGYLDRREATRYIRGRLEMAQVVRKPWDLVQTCRYQEHTPDLVENQILAWTLFIVARSGLLSERTSPVVRRTYRQLQSFATLLPFSAQDCVGLLYNRLNEDYEPLHALCRFFLENSGPTHRLGENAMMPFMVNMARLFELFVAEWLKAHLPRGLRMSAHEQIQISREGGLHWEIDLLIRDLSSDAARLVLDTKYKDSARASTDDIAQVIAYAQVIRCHHAVLVYPKPLDQPLDYWADDIRVQSATFDLGSNLEEAGQKFLAELEIVE